MHATRTESNLTTRALVGVLAAASAAIVLLATRRGVSVYNDSVHYISAARSLSEGHGFRDFTGQPLTTFPPMFPGLVAVGLKVGLSVPTAVRLINAAACALTVALSWVLLRRHVSSKAVAVVAIIALAFSFMLTRVAMLAMSESVFIAISVAGLVTFERATRAGERRLHLLVAAGAIYGLAFLTRYAAVALVLSGAIALLILRECRVKDRLVRCAVFLAASAAIPALWVVRNLTATAEPVGTRVPGDPLQNSIGTLIRAVGAVMRPARAPHTAAYLAFAWIALVIGFAIWVVRREADVDRGHHEVTLVPILSFELTFILFMWVSKWRTGSSLDARIMVPILVPTMVLSAVFIDRSLPLVAARFGRRAVQITLAVLALAVVAGSASTVVLAKHRGDVVPAEYADRALRKLPLVRAVRQLRNHDVVLSNNPYLLYYASDHEPSRYTPGRTIAGASLAPPSVADVAEVACRRRTYVAWFGDDEGGNKLLFPLRQLDRTIPLREFRTVADGTLYVLPKHAACAARSPDAAR